MFRSLRDKLLLLMILLSLIPMAGISAISYFFGSRQIAEDRIRLSLEQMAQDTADKIDLVLREKKEEAHSMATTFSLLYPRPSVAQREEITRILNNYCFNRDMYDGLLVLDSQGGIVAVNTIDRSGSSLPSESLKQILSGNIKDFPEEQGLFSRSISGHSSH